MLHFVIQIHINDMTLDAPKISCRKCAKPRAPGMTEGRARGTRSLFNFYEETLLKAVMHCRFGFSIGARAPPARPGSSTSPSREKTTKFARPSGNGSRSWVGWPSTRQPSSSCLSLSSRSGFSGIQSSSRAGATLSTSSEYYYITQRHHQA